MQTTNQWTLMIASGGRRRSRPPKQAGPSYVWAKYGREVAWLSSHQIWRRLAGRVAAIYLFSKWLADPLPWPKTETMPGLAVYHMSSNLTDLHSLMAKSRFGQKFLFYEKTFPYCQMNISSNDRTMTFADFNDKTERSQEIPNWNWYQPKRLSHSMSRP